MRKSAIFDPDWLELVKEQYGIIANMIHQSNEEDNMKAKTTKKAGRWITKKHGNKLVAKRLEPSTVYADPTQFSSATPTGAGSGVDASPTWTDKPQQPGLHLMRFLAGESFNYQAVRAVLVNDGLSECYQIKFANTPTEDLSMSQWTSPEFQKVSE